MKKNAKLRNIALVAILVAFAIIFAGSIMYYFYTFNGVYGFFEKLFMAIQNTTESMLFNPILPYGDMMDPIEGGFADHLGSVGRYFIAFYGFCMAVVPFVEVFVVFSFLDEMLRLFAHTNKKDKNHVLVVGYNDYVKRTIKVKSNENKIFLWTEKILSEEEERDLYERKITVVMNDMSLLEDPYRYDEQVKAFEKYIRKNKITHIMLMDESDATNIQYFIVLSNIIKDSMVRFFVACKSFKARNELQNYFDNQFLTEADNAKRVVDLRIFNFAEIQAEILFQEMPLFFGYDAKLKPSERDVHLLIVGSGHMGLQILLHAMNQAVFSSDNTITIDVVGLGCDYFSKLLRERFSEEYVLSSDDGSIFYIPSENSDGSLIIRLFEQDVREDFWIGTISDCNEDPCPYTYAVLCLPNPDDNLSCAIDLKKVLNKRIPLAIRMPYAEDMKKLFLEMPYVSTVYLMGKDEEYVGIDNIINNETEKQLRRFNKTYNLLSNAADGKVPDQSLDVDALWNNNEYYRKQSNRALFLHWKAKEHFYQETGKNIAEIGTLVAYMAGEDTMNAEELEAARKAILSNPELEEFGKMEHRRFCYFYASEGWGPTEGVKIWQRRLHNCLFNWDYIKENKKDYLIYDYLSLPVLMQKEDTARIVESEVKKKILIVNDDGIDSDGIKRLAKAALAFGDVWVVAPDGQRSAVSHSISLRNPIDVYPCNFSVDGVKAYKVTGTPADCVRLGILNLIENGPDIVLSGINYGYNCATDIQYSATAGAAFEATFHNVPAIALSEGIGDCHEVTDYYLDRILRELMKKEFVPGQIWNVNFPSCKLYQCNGVLTDRTVSRSAFYKDQYKKTEAVLDHNGTQYRVDGIYQEIAEGGTDLRAVICNYVSIGTVKNIGY